MTAGDDLESVLDDYESRQAAFEQGRRDQKAEAQRRTTAFDAIAANTIRPTLQRIADRLNDRGHRAEVSENAAGTLRGKEIVFRLALSGVNTKEPTAVLYFAASGADVEIRADTTEAGSGGTTRNKTVDSAGFTPAIVERWATWIVSVYATGDGSAAPPA